MRKEFEVLLKNVTWELIPFLNNVDPIGGKWVYRTKFLPNETFDKYKARFVTRSMSNKPFEHLL